jgi:CSLREA domain-containing protein
MKKTGPISTPFLCLGIALCLALAPVAGAAVFTVISAGDTDDGRCDASACTLRDAIKAANASSGADTIQFRIGSGPVAIRPATSLPAITDTVTLDGTTQPGFSGAPLIVLDGANSVSTGLSLSASNSLIVALVVCQFTGDGIQIFGNGNQVRGSYIGTDPSGSVAKPNGQRGVFVSGGSNNTIGGENPGDGNVVSGNQGDGVRITGGSGNLVRGNRIGTDVAGSHAVGNGASGVAIEGSMNNQVGCTTASARNVISGNAIGVTVTGSGSTGNLIGANYIGTDASGVSDLGNSGDGVVFASGASSNLVGGTGSESPNRIAFNRGNGISAQPGAGSGNTFRGNSLFSNRGIGIDLNADGPTRNDPGDSDAGPNGLQNYPVLLSLGAAIGSTSVTGTLNSTPGGAYTLEFFASGTGDSLSLGTTMVTTDSAGNAFFSTTLPAPVLATDLVTATATDSSGSTSELSPGIQSSMAVSTVSAPRAAPRRIPARPPE